jgi:hypothetical protein
VKWLALRVGGQRIAVHVVRRRHPKLAGCDGCYYPAEGRVYIASDLEQDAREDALFHELDHVVNEVGGVNAILEEHKVPFKEEERIVRARTPIWHRLLKDLGFRFPRGPYL